MQELGERLRGFVKDAGWEALEARIAATRDAGRRILLTIRSSAAELYALPWELLLLRSGERIGQVRNLLLRYEWPDTQSKPERPRPRREGGRILFAWSAAGGAVPAQRRSMASS